MRRVAIPAVHLMALAVAGCGGGGGGPAAPGAPVPPAASPSPSPAPTVTVLRRATIRGVNGHAAMGSARIERDGSIHTLHLGEDFRLDIGSTDVYLARNPGGVDEGDLNLGELRSLTGAQSFAMPDDGAQYAYVLLWCRPFRVPIGLGELQ